MALKFFSRKLQFVSILMYQNHAPLCNEKILSQRQKLFCFLDNVLFCYLMQHMCLQKKNLISFNKENVNFLRRDKNVKFFSAVEIEIHREISRWKEELIRMVEMS